MFGALMPLSAGDSVTLSISPVVWLTQYKALRPGATLTRVVGEKPEADVAVMRDDLRKLLWEAYGLRLRR